MSESCKKRFSKEYIPPEIRPIYTHMHDPSLFLPSSEHYSILPYNLSYQQSHGRHIENTNLPSDSGYFNDVGHDNDRCNNNQALVTERNSASEAAIMLGEEKLWNGQRLNQVNSNTDNQSTVMTSSVDSDHTHYLKTADDENDCFFEVNSDWMELTIAREEEVTSSLFDEMTSSSLYEEVTSSLFDEMTSSSLYEEVTSSILEFDVY